MFLDRETDEVRPWQYMNTTMSWTINLCAIFEQKQFIKYVISIKNLRKHFSPGPWTWWCTAWQHMIIALSLGNRLVCNIWAKNQVIRYVISSKNVGKHFVIGPRAWWGSPLTVHEYFIVTDNKIQQWSAEFEQNYYLDLWFQ